MSFELVASIPEAKRYKTYELANKAEVTPGLMVDSLSDNHIEIHAEIDELEFTNNLREKFCNIITNFINGNNVECKMTINKEIFIHNKKPITLDYVVMNFVNGEMS